MAFMFEKLDVYQKAVDFADEIAAGTEGLPRGYGFLGNQLNLASLSKATAASPSPIATTSSRSPEAPHRNVLLCSKLQDTAALSKRPIQSPARTASRSSRG
jgi:hypothetical protein